MSLADLRKVTEQGVVFKSHLDGSKIELTPERSMEVQHLLDADITMAFDECIKWPAEEAEAARAMNLSMRWAERSKPDEVIALWAKKLMDDENRLYANTSG